MPLTESPPVQDRTPTPAPQPQPPPPTPRRLHLTATQLLASALAAVTATFAASYLGVAGTVIGAAVASVVSVVGNAVYSLSIQHTGHRVRTAVPAAGRLAAWSTNPGPAATPPVAPNPAGERPAPRDRTRLWPIVAAACVGIFAGVLLLVTVTELVAGRPLTDLLRDRPGAGTTVFGADVAHVTGPTPTPTVTVTVVPKVVTTTPTVTATAPAVTTTPPSRPSPTPTSPSATPTASPSPSGSATSTSTGP
jgi:hypothetical protein